MSHSDKQIRRQYKNTHLDADELRKRREETSIILRKQKRDEQFLKKRNVDLPNDDDSDGSSNMQDFNNANNQVNKSFSFFMFIIFMSLFLNLYIYLNLNFFCRQSHQKCLIC